jgi:hypothetical protein
MDFTRTNPDGSVGVDVAALWADTQRLVADLLGPIGWAEEEAEQAQRCYPDQADVLYHAIPLTRPTWGEPLTEFLVRGHARELFARVAAGDDPRPGTDAEVCVACMRASLEAPLTEATAGLYGRCFTRILPDDVDNPWADAQPHEEALHGSQIDDLERRLRADIGRRVAAKGLDRRLRDGRGRLLPAITCKGLHHGEEVACRFAKAEPTQLAPPTPADPVTVGDQPTLFQED